MSACLTPEEQRLWTDANARLGQPAPSPCFDCPLAFAQEMRRAGCCDGVPQAVGRPRMSSTTDRERWRRASQAKRDRRKAA